MLIISLSSKFEKYCSYYSKNNRNMQSLFYFFYKFCAILRNRFQQIVPGPTNPPYHCIHTKTDIVHFGLRLWRTERRGRRSLRWHPFIKGGVSLAKGDDRKGRPYADERMIKMRRTRAWCGALWVYSADSSVISSMGSALGALTKAMSSSPVMVSFRSRCSAISSRRARLSLRICLALS